MCQSQIQLPTPRCLSQRARSNAHRIDNLWLYTSSYLSLKNSYLFLYNDTKRNVYPHVDIQSVILSKWKPDADSLPAWQMQETNGYALESARVVVVFFFQINIFHRGQRRNTHPTCFSEGFFLTHQSQRRWKTTADLSWSSLGGCFSVYIQYGR